MKQDRHGDETVADFSAEENRAYGEGEYRGTQARSKQRYDLQMLRRQSPPRPKPLAANSLR
jgi:hypothetical protein